MDRRLSADASGTCIRTKEEATKVKPQLRVFFQGEKEPKTGTIIYYNPIADAGADRQQIRLELPNHEDRPAGLNVQVEVPTAPGADNNIAEAKGR